MELMEFFCGVAARWQDGRQGNTEYWFSKALYSIVWPKVWTFCVRYLYYRPTCWYLDMWNLETTELCLACELSRDSFSCTSCRSYILQVGSACYMTRN